MYNLCLLYKMSANIPLSLRIRGESHRRIALAQDFIVGEVYKLLNHAVFHGGTAIWRCYSGKRFSEDLDFYFPKNISLIEELFINLEKRGFKIVKKKISSTSVYSEMEFERVFVRLEATYRNIKGKILDYETVNNNWISVYSLGPEQFIIEKINTYLKRFKIRDLYDIFFLLKKIENLNSIRADLKKLLSNYKRPLDGGDLKVLIFEGIVPSSEEMIDYIKSKFERIK